MRNIIVILFFLPFTVISQEIKWTTVPYKAINPDELFTRGIIELDNGDETPEADLSIDFGKKIKLSTGGIISCGHFYFFYKI